MISIDHLTVSTHNWKLSARRLRALILSNELILHLDHAHFSPCSGKLDWISLSSRSAQAKILNREELTLHLSEPSLDIGGLNFRLPNLTINPQRPKLVRLRLSYLDERPSIDIGPSLQFLGGSVTPSVFVAIGKSTNLQTTHRHSNLGIGVAYRINRLSLASRLSRQLGTDHPMITQLEAQGGDRFFSAHGGLIYRQPLFVRSDALLGRQLTPRPRKLWGKVNLYESQSITSALNYYAEERSIIQAQDAYQYDPLQNILWSNYLDHTYSYSNQKISGVHLALSQHLGLSNKSRSLNVDPAWSSISDSSFTIVPYRHTALGSVHGMIGGELQVTSLNETRRSINFGLDYDLSLYRVGASKKWRHHILINPRFLSGLTIGRGLNNDRTQRDRVGVAIRQQVTYKALDLALDYWAGYGLSGPELSSENRNKKRLETAIRAHLEHSRLQVDYSGDYDQFGTAQQVVFASFLLDPSTERSEDLMSEKSSSSASIYYYRERVGGSRDLVLNSIFVPFALWSARPPSYLLNHIKPLAADQVTPASRQTLVASLQIDSKHLRVGLNLGSIQTEEAHLDQRWSLSSAVNSITLKSACGCWYFTLLSGLVNHPTINHAPLDKRIGLRLGLGVPTNQPLMIN